MKKKKVSKKKTTKKINSLTREEILLENFLELVNETQQKITYNAFAQYGGGGGTVYHTTYPSFQESIMNDCM